MRSMPTAICAPMSPRSARPRLLMRLFRSFSASTRPASAQGRFRNASVCSCRRSASRAGLHDRGALSRAGWASRFCGHRRERACSPCRRAGGLPADPEPFALPVRGIQPRAGSTAMSSPTCSCRKKTACSASPSTGPTRRSCPSAASTAPSSARRTDPGGAAVYRQKGLAGGMAHQLHPGSGRRRSCAAVRKF